MCSRDHHAHTLNKEMLRAFEVLALQAACSLIPLELTPRSSSVTLSAEDSTVESTWSPPHRDSLFQISKDLMALFTSWAVGGGAQPVEFCPGMLLVLFPCLMPSDRKPGSSQRPSLPAGVWGS